MQRVAGWCTRGSIALYLIQWQNQLFEVILRFNLKCGTPETQTKIARKK